MNGLSGGLIGSGIASLVLAGLLAHSSFEAEGEEWDWRIRWMIVALIAGGFQVGFGATL